MTPSTPLRAGAGDPHDPRRAAQAASARRRQAWRTYALFGSLLLVAMAGAPLVGSTPLDLRAVLDRSRPFADNLDAQIFFIARLPRVLAAGIVGATLAVAGVVMQALLRNPLATPFTLGVSSGSALGAMLALTFIPAWTGGVITSVPLASLAGALGAVLIVYALAQVRHRGFSTDVLLLAGVTLNAFFSALILLVQYLSDFTETMRTLRWLMGDLDVAGYRPLAIAVVSSCQPPPPSRGYRAASMRWRSGPSRPGLGACPWSGCNVWRSSRRRWPRAWPSRWPGRSGSSASSCRTWCGCSWARITGSVLPASALFGAAFLAWRATRSRAGPPSNCRWAWSPRCWGHHSSYGC